MAGGGPERRAVVLCEDASSGRERWGALRVVNDSGDGDASWAPINFTYAPEPLTRDGRVVRLLKAQARLEVKHSGGCVGGGGFGGGALRPAGARSGAVAYRERGLLRAPGSVVVEDSVDSGRRVVEGGCRVLALEPVDGAPGGAHARAAAALSGGHLGIEIFKTSDGKGWGVRATRALEKGMFLGSYSGELELDDAAADAVNMAYTWDLDHFVVQAEEVDNSDGGEGESSQPGPPEPHEVLSESDYDACLRRLRASTGLRLRDSVRHGQPVSLMALAAAIDAVGGAQTNELAAQAGRQAGLWEDKGAQGTAELAQFVKRVKADVLDKFDAWWHGSGAFDGVSARAARSAELNAELQRLWTTDAGQPIALSLKGELVGNWTRWMNDGGETSSNVECVPVLTPWATWGNVDACTPAGFSYGGGCAGPAETPRLYRMAFFAGSDIGAGEELLYNYGKGYWSKRSDAEPVYAGRAPPAAGPSLFYDGALASEHTMQTPEDELATEEDDAGVEDAAQLVVSSPGWSPR